MLSESKLATELTREQKLEVARAGVGVDSESGLHALVLLALDADSEIRRIAEETLRRIPDERCAHLLAWPATSVSTARYFLRPEHARPATLPVLLAHPASPPEAIVFLAAQANAELISVLLAHLQDLKTAALIALKQNPAYLEWQKSVPAPPADGTTTAIKPEQLQATRERLAEMAARACGGDASSRVEAEAALQTIPDNDCLELLATTSLAPEVAQYFLAQAPARLALLPLLLGHPDSPQDAITNLAATAGAEVVSVLLDNLDLLKTPALLALKQNPTYLQWQKSPPSHGYVLEVDLLDLLIEEMATEHPPTEEEVRRVLDELSDAVEKEPEIGGIVQKIALMKVAQRVKLALLGTREERSLLIRDSSRVVTRAVLSSPKISDSEVESFAGMKNVSQDVLRLMSMNRKFMKSYVVVRSLASNPRTPLDVSLPLLNRLILNDLRIAAASKDIPDTLRKMAKKLLEVRSQ